MLWATFLSHSMGSEHVEASGLLEVLRVAGDWVDYQLRVNKVHMYLLLR